MSPAPSSSHGVTVLAQVSLSANVNNWDGLAVPFNVVDYDPDGLWVAASHHFQVKVAGWYAVRAFDASGNHGIVIDTTAGGQGAGVWLLAYALNAGAGSSLFASANVQVAGISVALPPIAGVTHLEANETLEVDGDGGTGWSVTGGYTFSIELLAAT